MKQFFGRKSRSTLGLVIMVSFLLHVVGIVVFGTIKLVSEVLREETVFEAAPIAPPPQKEPEYTVNIKQRNESTPPPRPPTIVVNNPNELDIPALDIDVNVDSTSVYGRGGGGFGGGLAGIRDMAITLTDFGYTGKTEGTLEATLIDLKRNRSGKPIGGGGSRTGPLREFTDSNWSLSNLTRKYYSAKNKLYGSYWMIENGPAAKAPKSFGVEKEIQPSRIAALYEGTYTPPNDMHMRFVGMADDVLIVRLDSKIVLDASWQGGYSKVPINEDGPRIPSIPKPLRNGEWIQLRRGQTYDLKILLAEIPGGFFCSYLFYQTKGSDKLKIFSTKPFTSQERNAIRKMHPEIAKLL